MSGRGYATAVAGLDPAWAFLVVGVWGAGRETAVGGVESESTVVGVETGRYARMMGRPPGILKLLWSGSGLQWCGLQKYVGMGVSEEGGGLGK